MSTRLVRLRLQSNGSLPRSPLLAATARAALLADLASSGALTRSGAGLEVDTTPTGFEPADLLLAGVAAQPNKTLEWWVRRGPDSLRAIVADLVVRGVWIHRPARLGRRHRDTDPAAVRADAALLHSVLDGAPPDTPATAVLAALLGVIGADRLPGDRSPAKSLLAASGAAEWLLGDLADYLLRYRRLLGAAAGSSL